jgi:predicted N-acetyltransferase YhbS
MWNLGPDTMIRLRPMAWADAPAVAALIRSAFAAQSVPTDPAPSALRETAESIASHLTTAGGAVAEADGQLVGCVLWQETDGGLYIGRLAVDPAWRRRGTARALVAAAEATARELGLPRLHLGTRLPLLDNRRLFAACGFVETVRSAHPGYTEPTTVAMEKRLAR